MKTKFVALAVGLLFLPLLTQFQAQAKNGGQVRILKDGQSVAVVELPDLPQAGKREIKMSSDQHTFDRKTHIWTFKGNVLLQVFNGTRKLMQIKADEAKLEPTVPDPQ